MSINSIEVRIHLNYKFNLRLFKFLSPIYFELQCDVIRPRPLTAFCLGITQKPRGKYLRGICLVKTFAGMVQVYTGYLATIRDWMDFLVGN